LKKLRGFSLLLVRIRRREWSVLFQTIQDISGEIEIVSAGAAGS
jgi:hypothetical protein